MVPRSRFIFDNYNLEPEKESISQSQSVDKISEKSKNYFSFFEEEKKILKP